jgi:hypothetical protein
VLVLLYITGFVLHVLIFRHNQHAQRPFRLSLLLIYLCFMRVVTLSLRMAWATHPTSGQGLVIAAQVFVTAGVLLLFVLDLILAHRLLCALHPRVGWHPAARGLFAAGYVLVGASLVAVVSCFVQSLYTGDAYTRQVDHGMILYGGTFFLVVAFFPVPFVGISYGAFVVGEGRGSDRGGAPHVDKAPREVLPQHPRMEGSVARGSAILVVGALLLTLGAGFRTGVAYAPARPASDPAWYDSKASFYMFDFVTELGVIYLYAVSRVDGTFYIPAVNIRERSGETA